MGTLYSNRGNLAIGFHGCKKEVAKSLIENPQDIHISKNKYDWLGWGFYIWENNMERALEWAVKSFGKENAAVVGVIYELGTCLDLMDSHCIQMIKEARVNFVQDMLDSGNPVPKNKDLARDPNKDKILRNLDCAVINYLTSVTDDYYISEIKDKGYCDVMPYDSVRGCFMEGAKIQDMEIFEETHIQIAIRNLNCIKGIFLPRVDVIFPE